MATPLERVSAALADRYTILRELGEGGMATVFLAQDRKHDRPVAVKVLKPELAAVLGGERFVVEIKTTAALQHPHILPLFDSGEADGILYYVMPFIEGETLRARLDRERQLGVQEAVRIAGEVADALDYAHRHGVIHRDIKPENILLHDGRATVADFGIALAVSAAAGGRMTETGLSLGTPHYMSPEQATAEKEITGRSDIYSLASVLYEMLTGEPPHMGKSAQQIIMKIIVDPVKPITDLRKSVPPHVADAVATALEKLPADRFASAKEFGAALVGADGGTRQRNVAVASSRAVPVRLAALAIGSGLVMLAAGLLAGRHLLAGPADAAPPAVLTVEVSGLTFNPFQTTELSADGQTIVFFGEQSTAMVRRLAEHNERPLPIIGRGTNPVISPNGRRLLFSWQGATHVIDLTGGQPVHLPGVPEDANVVWADDATLAYEGGDGIVWERRVTADATPRLVARPDSLAGEDGLLPLDMLPGSSIALIQVSPGSGQAGPVDALDLRTGQRTRILDTPVRGAGYAGHRTLVYATPDGMLHGVAFDPRRLRVSGPAVPIGGPAASTMYGQARVSTSRTGSVLYVPLSPSALVQLDRSGTRQTLVDNRSVLHNPRVAPDGRRVAVDVTDADGRDVWLYSFGTGTLERATFENTARDALWGRDGQSLFYMASAQGRVTLLHRRLDGSPPVPASNDTVAELAGPGSALPDGSLILMAPPAQTASGWDLVRLDSEGAITPLLATPFNEAWADASPDGRWLAYASDESRRTEVYVASLQGMAQRLRVSMDGGTEPRWSPRGDELFYIRPGSNGFELMVARLEMGAEPRVVSRTALFPWNEFDTAEPHTNYDVMPDGQGIIAIHRGMNSRLTLIQNVHTLVHGGQ